MNWPWNRCRSLALALPVWLALVAAGCAHSSGRSSGPIGELHLFGLPTALTVAGSSVAGGAGIKLYASQVGGSKGLPIRRGRLEVLMFDRSAAGLDPQTEKPLKIWTFGSQDLAPFESSTMVGTGYQLELKWDQDRPKGRVFTVVARYRDAGKPDIYSSPAAIAMATH